jgi:hypothetical protein
MGNPETLVTLATQETGQRLEKTQGQTKNGQSRDTGNIGYTRHRTKVRENPRANQEWEIQRLLTLGTQDTGQRLEKTQGKSRVGNPETLVDLGIQDTGQRLEKTKGQIKNGQSRDTGNMGCTRHRTKVRENQRANQEWAFQRH